MKEMDADKLQKLSNDMDRCQVDLKFPKFTTEMDLSLNQIISKLGAPFFSGKLVVIVQSSKQKGDIILKVKDSKRNIEKSITLQAI